MDRKWPALKMGIASTTINPNMTRITAALAMALKKNMFPAIISFELLISAG
jgi:hypothetical protein